MHTLEQAILATLTYADIFDYPLTGEEVHRYLVGVRSTPERVCTALDSGRLLSGRVKRIGEFYVLPGRDQIVPTRQRRELKAAQLWPRAIHYGKAIGRLPGVRMVALTGSLTMNNVENSADLDYLVVTRPGRLWLTRACVILLVRLAALRGDVVCPNYFLSEQALVLQDRSLFTAHELVQMVPLSGVEVYLRMRAVNPWTVQYLPNAGSEDKFYWICPSKASLLHKVLEVLLNSPMAGWVERWEMERKIRKFKRLAHQHAEAHFSADCCKGHLDDHGQRVLSAYGARLSSRKELQAG